MPTLPHAVHDKPLPSGLSRLDVPVPAPGQPSELTLGVRWLRMPLPFALDHINLWLVRDELEGQQGWTAIDTGVCSRESKDVWESVVSSHLEGLPLLRLLCTHMHPDHVGLAAWLCDGLADPPEPGRWRIPLWMTQGEYTAARMFASPGLSAEADEQMSARGLGPLAHYERHGLVTAEAQDKAMARRSHFSRMVPRVPLQYRRLYPDETFQMGGQEWRVIVGYGHSPEHAALYCEESRLLISGDMVLPRISTNVSVWFQEPEADPVSRFLSSLDRFRHLPDDTLVLPSHGVPFRGLHARIEQLHLHHQKQLEACLGALDEPRTAYELLPVLFPRELDSHQLHFAMGEAIAHLQCLEQRGAVQRRMRGDVVEFVRSGEAP